MSSEGAPGGALAASLLIVEYFSLMVEYSRRLLRQVAPLRALRERSFVVRHGEGGGRDVGGGDSLRRGIFSKCRERNSKCREYFLNVENVILNGGRDVGGGDSLRPSTLCPSTLNPSTPQPSCVAEPSAPPPSTLNPSTQNSQALETPNPLNPSTVRATLNHAWVTSYTSSRATRATPALH